MVTVSEFFSRRRLAKHTSLTKASRDLAIKKEILVALEAGEWGNLPEPAFVKGFIKNYAEYLGLDPKHALALYRREFDEAKYPKKLLVTKTGRGLKKLTFPTILNLTFTFAIIFFVTYLFIQYLSILSAPQLLVVSPPSDFTTNVPVVAISGQTEKGATVSVNGEFAPVDSQGNFSYQVKLNDGKNIIEIIVAKRLSPKTKTVRIVRLSQ